MTVFRFLIVSLCLVMALSTARADDLVFARQGDLVLTHQEIDAAFAQIPEMHRGYFIRDGSRVDQLIQNLFRNKLVAADAVAHGYDEDPITASRLKLVAEKELAVAWMEQVMKDAPQADYEALAHERYLANPENYQSETMVDVTHILIQSDNKPKEEARQKAEELRAQLLDKPELFDQYVLEYSEDPAKSQNKGRYAMVQRGQMVKPFEDMAFSMQTPGEISEIVETAYGFHILRLNAIIPAGTLPFEQVRGELEETVRKEYLEDYQTRYIFKLVPEPIQIEEGAVEEMAKRHFGENFEQLPDYLK